MTGYGARAVAVLSMVVSLAACGGKEKPGQAAPSRAVVSGVEVVEVRPVPRESSVEAMGTVRATTVASVAPQVMGRLTAVLVSEGARVEKGAVLATIDDQAARAQLAAAEGAVAEAEAAKEEVERAVAQAEASKELAEKTHERYRKLLEEKVVTPQEYDEVALRRTIAVNDHERALRKAAQVDGKVAQAKGSAGAARAQLGYTRVTAPFSGVVLEKKADAGSMAVPACRSSCWKTRAGTGSRPPSPRRTFRCSSAAPRARGSRRRAGNGAARLRLGSRPGDRPGHPDVRRQGGAAAWQGADGAVRPDPVRRGEGKRPRRTDPARSRARPGRKACSSSKAPTTRSA
jgi:pyruvate/2-oxoglutarate dehydrogenase complex dihydrolipoamide acyltransferase (E2) component